VQTLLQIQALVVVVVDTLFHLLMLVAALEVLAS
jgi:hypothetical protein